MTFHWLSFCPQLKTDGSLFHPHLWPKSFYHQPCNGRVNLNTSLSTQFGDSWLVFIEPSEHTLLNILRNQYVFHTFLGCWELSFKLTDCNLLVTVNEFISTLKQNQCDSCFWLARWCMSLSFAGPPSEPAVCEVHWLTVLLSTTLSSYIFFNHL